VPPSIGSIVPRVANPGTTITVSGTGFGASTGTVNFTVGSATVAAQTTQWSDGQVTAVVPEIAAGSAQVTVSQGTATSSTAPFQVNTAALIPVNFSVSSVPSLATSDAVMLTGNLAELGNEATTWNGAVGPVTIPSTGNGLLTVSVPAGSTLQFKFFVLHSDGTVTSETSYHSYSVPISGVGTEAVTW
jgi:hypothetical protein